MSNFIYRDKTISGSLLVGKSRVSNKSDVISKIKRQDIIPDIVGRKFIKRRVSKSDILLFTRNLSSLLKAGVPLTSALESQTLEGRNSFFRSVLKNVTREVNNGFSFASALEAEKSTFDELYINTIKAGEEGGRLEDVLLRLSLYIEKRMETEKKIKAALIYPMIVIGVTLVSIFVFTTFVIPVYSQFFTEFSEELPIITRMVITTASFLKKFFIPVVCCIIILIFSFKRYFSTEKGMISKEKIVSKLPFLGELVLTRAIGRFAFAFGLLFSSGVSILNSLKIGAKASGSIMVEQSIIRARKKIMSGEAIHLALSREKIFSPTLLQIISVGESTGGLTQALERISSFYENESERITNTLTSLMEPVIIVFLSVIIGFIVIAMYLPIFKLPAIVH